MSCTAAQPASAAAAPPRTSNEMIVPKPLSWRRAASCVACVARPGYRVTATCGWLARRSARIIAFRCARSRHCKRPAAADPPETFQGCPVLRRRVRARGVARPAGSRLARDDAAEQVRVSANEFRHRLHRHIGAERQWPLVQRRRERGVDAEKSATLARGRAEHVQVGHRQQRGSGRRSRVPRPPGSNRRAAQPPLQREVARTPLRSPPCRRQRRRASHPGVPSSRE